MPDPALQERCADCGRKVERGRNGHWGARRTEPPSLVFVCRSTIEGGVLVAADYHYIEGEEQRHFGRPT